MFEGYDFFIYSFLLLFKKKKIVGKIEDNF